MKTTVALLGSVLLASFAQAGSYTQTSSHTYTVGLNTDLTNSEDPAGYNVIKDGATVETYGDPTFNYTTYGVFDFSTAGFASLTGNIVSGQINLIDVPSQSSNVPQDEHGFIYLANSSVDATKTSAALDTNHNSAGVDNKYGPLVLAGDYSYSVSISDNTAIDFALSVDSSVQSAIASAISGNTGLRLILVSNPNDAFNSSAASPADMTVTGQGATALPSLTLTTQAAPEPFSLAILGIGAAGLLRRKRA